jgi:hypothetical protein
VLVELVGSARVEPKSNSFCTKVTSAAVEKPVVLPGYTTPAGTVISQHQRRDRADDFRGDARRSSDRLEGDMSL